MSESTGALIPFQEQAVSRPETPREMIAAASDQANALADVIERCKLYTNIQGKKYVRVEGWCTLARFNSVIPRELSNEAKEDGRYVATVAFININDGRTLTVASAECGGPDEPMWQSRPPFARRSMAATRATGKAARLAYAWILALAGKYETTPAEEMDHVAGKVIEADPFDAATNSAATAQAKPVAGTRPEPQRFQVQVFLNVESLKSAKGKPYWRIQYSTEDGIKTLTTFSETAAREAEVAVGAGIGGFIEVRSEWDKKTNSWGWIIEAVDRDEPPF